MYFKSRVEAGQELAKMLKKHRGEKCAVVALGDGGAVVGAQIALKLRCVLMMLMTDDLMIPGEIDPLGSISQDGLVTYSRSFSEPEIDEFTTEYHHYLEQEKLEKVHSMNRTIGLGGIIRRDLLRGHNVILTTDGLQNSMVLDAAADFLKSIHIEKLIIATPIATVTAVDRMHLLGDELYCLSVIENYITTDHYYDDNDIPDKKTTVETIKEIVKNWK